MKKKLLLLSFQLLLTITVLAQTYKFTSTDLNLRSGPGTTYPVLAVIPVGTSIEMSESCDCTWLKIQSNGKIGYVSTRYLSDKQIIRVPNTTRSKRNPGTTPNTIVPLQVPLPYVEMAPTVSAETEEEHVHTTAVWQDGYKTVFTSLYRQV